MEAAGLKGLVSVVIPCYNAETYLKAALESVEKQSYGKWEIILVDDGSRDASLAVSKTFQATLAEPARMQILTGLNQGPSTARNRGIENAHGAYLLFLDADDWLEVDALKTLVTAMEQAPAIDFAFMGFRRWVQQKEIYKPYRFPLLLKNRIFTGQDFFITYLKHKYMMMLACGLYRKDRLMEWKLRFDTEQIYGEDVKFQMTYFLSCRRAATCNYIGMTYRIHPASLIMNYSKPSVEKQKEYINATIERMEQIGGLHSSYAKRLYEVVYYNVYMDFLGAEDTIYRRITLLTAFSLWLTHPITARHVFKSNFRAWKNSFENGKR